MRIPQLLLPVLALVGVLAAPAPDTAGAQPPRADTRTRPPEQLPCPPNELTSYAGRVVGYSRTRDRTTLRIRTDWETTERVTVRHPGSDDPVPWFRYRGGPFADSDWSRIEVERGKLRDAVRATAWVCRDGRVVVDWDR